MASREFSKIGAWGVSWGPQKYFSYPNDHLGQGEKAYFEQMGSYQEEMSDGVGYYSWFSQENTEKGAKVWWLSRRPRGTAVPSGWWHVQPCWEWNVGAQNAVGPFSCRRVTTDTLGCLGSKAAGLWRAQCMGDQWQSSPLNHRSSEAGGRPDGGRDNEVLGMGMQGMVSRSRRTTDTRHPHDGELRFEDQEEETLPEEVTGEEVPSPRNTEVALEQLDRVLEKDAEEGVSEMSRLSITQRFPSFSSVRGRKRKRRVFELAKPKTNWQVLKDRLGCCCEGYAWVSPRRRSLEFCVYWPSVYWTERFLEDTTLTITVPEVSRRVEELARPKRFYWEYYNNNRTTPIWPVPRSSLEYQASSRLRELAAPRVRNNIWSINMSEVSQVSRAAQMAIPSPRILRLAKPRVPATRLEEWDPMPKPKPYVSDYNRLLHLATPKAQSNQCVPDRDPRWEVLDVTKKAVASPRIVSLAKPKVRKDLNEGYDPYHISPASLVARASPRLYELATPKNITKKV